MLSLQMVYLKKFCLLNFSELYHFLLLVVGIELWHVLLFACFLYHLCLSFWSCREIKVMLKHVGCVRLLNPSRGCREEVNLWSCSLFLLCALRSSFHAFVCKLKIQLPVKTYKFLLIISVMTIQFWDCTSIHNFVL